MDLLYSVVALVLLIGTLGLSGCLTLKDGSKSPDYILIQAGSYATTAITISNMDMTKKVAVKITMQLNKVLVDLNSYNDGELINIKVISKLLSKHVSPPYDAIGILASELINSRIEVHLTESQQDTSDLIIKITKSVISGAKRALQDVRD